MTQPPADNGFDVRTERRANHLRLLVSGELDLFREADLAVGEKLVREHKCSECHARRVGGDGAAIYRPKGRVNTPAVLRGMVEQCNLELNLAFFPDEITSIAAVLNRDHYRFK